MLGLVFKILAHCGPSVGQCDMLKFYFGYELNLRIVNSILAIYSSITIKNKFFVTVLVEIISNTNVE